MDKFIILLRGINVGGKNRVAMKELVSLLEAYGFENVSYYIQSGNIVLDAKNTLTVVEIQAIISEQFSVCPDIMILPKNEFLTIVKNNPYTDCDGKSVHFYFCQNTIHLNMEKIKHYRSATERYEVVANVLYLHAPDGIGRSKLVTHIESCLGQSGTGRNLNTVNKLITMLS